MKKSFYLKYQDQIKINDKEQRLKQKYKLDDYTVVIEKSSIFFMQLLALFKSAVRTIGYILLMVFISLGITAIVNKEIRLIILNYIFGG